MLKFLVDDLKRLWNGVNFKTHNGTIIFIRAFLMACSCDIPAARKLCGFSFCTAIKGCSRCNVSFPSFSERDIDENNSQNLADFLESKYSRSVDDSDDHTINDDENSSSDEDSSSDDEDRRSDDADNNAVIVQSLEDVSPVLEIFAKAVSAGELDKALATLAQRKKDLRRPLMLTTHNPTKIAALNDAARKSFLGRRVYITPSVQAQHMVSATKKT